MKGKSSPISRSAQVQATTPPLGVEPVEYALHGFIRTFEREQIAPGAVKHSGRYLFLVLGGSLLARGLRYRAKLKNILGDFGNRPGFWSCLH
jgi:hypothetical protein